MTRFNEVVELLSVEVTVKDDGTQASTVKSSMAFANKYTLGLTSWAAAVSMGLHADAQVSMRSCDYAGQQKLRMGGIEYDIESAREKGEFVTLTLKRRLDNA